RSHIPAITARPCLRIICGLTVTVLSMFIGNAQSLPLVGQQISSSSSTAENAQHVRELALGVPVERDLVGREVHVYKVATIAGQYLNGTVEQKGIDVIARVFEPDGQLLVEMNIADGMQGLEPISVVAEKTGNFRLEISAIRKEAVPGRYLVGIEELREANQKDHTRVAGQSAYLEARRLDAQGTAETHKGAVEKYEVALMLWREANYLRGQAQTLNDLGAAFAQLGERRKGIEYCNQARELWQAVGDRQMEAGTLNNLGWISHLLGENKKALEFLLQALPLQRATEDRRGEALTLNDIGLV